MTGVGLSLLALGYALALHQVYVRVIEPVHAYAGFVSTTPWVGGALLAGALVVFPLAWRRPRPLMPRILQRPSDFVVWILFILVYVPSVTIPHYHPLTHGWPAVKLTLMLFVAWIALLVTLWLPSRRLPQLDVPPATFGRIVMFAAVALLAAITLAVGPPERLPTLGEEYVARANFKASIREGGWAGTAGYLVPWTGNIVLPALFGLSLYLRKPMYGIVAGAGIAVIYGLTGSKAALFAPLLVLAAFIVASKKRHLGTTMLLGALGVVLIPWLMDLLLKGAYFSTLFPRRLMLVPGLLDVLYYDFFSQNPKALFAHSKINPFVEPIYDVPPPNLIGRVYFGSVEDHTNANVFIDAYANGGFVTMVAIAILLGFLLSLFDSAARGKNGFIALVVVAMPALDLSNGSLPTVMFTHGMGLALLLMMLVPRATLEPESGDVAASAPRSAGEID